MSYADPTRIDATTAVERLLDDVRDLRATIRTQVARIDLLRADLDQERRASKERSDEIHRQRRAIARLERLAGGQPR